MTSSDAYPDLLPPLPAGIRPSRSNDEIAQFEVEHPNLPKSPAQCITCSGEKTFRWYKNEPYDSEIIDYACPCNDQFIAHREFLRCGVELRYQRQTWSDLHTVDAHRDEVLSDYLDNYRKYLHAGVGLILTGEPGTGKSMLTALILKKMIGRGIGCRMVGVPKLINEYTNQWNRTGSVNAQQKFDREFRMTGILAIDDLSREWRSSSSTDKNSRSLGEAALEDVLRARTQACLPTIISTNKSTSELHEAYPSHVMNVLEECSFVVNFTGDNGRPAMMSRTATETKIGITRPIFYFES